MAIRASDDPSSSTAPPVESTYEGATARSSGKSTAPCNHETLAQLAEARLRSNQMSEGFALYMQAVNACPSIRLYKERFLDLARHGIRVPHSKDLEDALAACLKTPELAGEIENWSSLLLSSADFRAVYALDDPASFGAKDESCSRHLIDLDVLRRPLFVEGLKSHVVCDPVFEGFITRLRRQLLNRLDDGEGRWPEHHVALASAVAFYAGLTDFILNETEDETRRIDELQRRLEATGVSASNPASVAIFACYRPLSVLRNAKEILRVFKDAEPLGALVKEQIEDRAWIDATAGQIRAETSVDDHRSMLVREQYELFPYPQWKMLSKRIIVREWLRDGGSRSAEGFLRHGTARILVAGCGTGRDAAIYAMRFPTSSITAMDLSRTSLAYGALRAKEHGLENLSFVHGDILNLRQTGRIFDYVCCVGVLHHMENPIEGWTALRDVLKANGLMKVGLYSRKGRAAIGRAQAAARMSGYPGTREGILRFRRESRRILDSEIVETLSRLKDYYNTGMYRDLLFPAKEHRFDLSEIKAALRQLGLTFEGFNAPSDVLASYRSMFPNDHDAKDLDCWEQYEAKNPETFANMYIFWCRRAPPPMGPAGGK